MTTRAPLRLQGYAAVAAGPMPLDRIHRRGFPKSAVLLTALLATVVGAWLLAGRGGREALLRPSARARADVEASSVMQAVQDLRQEGGRCGVTEVDVDYHTELSLYTVNQVVSAALCCAECEKEPLCGAWTWGKTRGMPGLTDVCFLKDLAGAAKPVKVPKAGVVSGQKDSAGLAAAAPIADASLSGKDASKDLCPGSLSLLGHGRVALVNAEQTAPGETGGRVEVESGVIVPKIGGRAYFADSCSSSSNAHEGVANAKGPDAKIKLLGKTMKYSANISEVGCGCSAALYLASSSRCGGGSCAEIDIQKANQYAWSTTLRARDAAYAPGVGYGGGAGTKGRHDWTGAQYGPGGECIDTSQPFEVAVSFPIDGEGRLEAVEIALTQAGRHCPLSASVTDYRPGGSNGLADISAVLLEGMTPVVSYSESKDAVLLDEGPCVQDAPEACADSVRFYDFAIQEIEEGQLHSRKKLTDVVAEKSHRAMEQKETLARRSVRSASYIGLEWEAVRDGVEVRREMFASSQLIETRPKGALVVGRRVGMWVSLLFGDEHGYVEIAPGGKTQLEERRTSYAQLARGSCADVGMFPITDYVACKAVASALGYDSVVGYYAGPRPRPEGCHALGLQLWLATNPLNSGRGAVGPRQPFCSGKAYPAASVNSKATIPGVQSPTTATSTSTGTITTITSTSTTHKDWGWPSFFCFSVMRRVGYEPELVKAQLAKRASIFDCDEYAVFSDGDEMSLGDGPLGELMTTPIPPIKGDQGKFGADGVTTNSWLNTMTFMQVWDAVHRDGRFRQHDWTLKVDPDAVFFPARLRSRLGPYTLGNASALYAQNCARYPDIQMLGSLEIVSRKAVEAYISGAGRCRTELHWKGWGEDFFLQHCLDLLGVGHVDADSALSDVNCFATDCADGGKAAFHPFKSVSSYFACWGQAVESKQD